MKKASATIAIFAVTIIALALFSGIEYVQTSNLNSQLSEALNSNSELQQSLSVARESITSIQTTTIMQDTTVVMTSSLSVLYINVSSVTFQVACCLILPEAFYLGKGYYFEDSIYAPPPSTVNGTVRTQAAGVLLVFAVKYGSSTEYLNFSWSGTFAEVVPYPSNATAFNSAVVMDWFTNSTSTQPYAMQTLYLRIDTS